MPIDVMDLTASEFAEVWAVRGALLKIFLTLVSKAMEIS
tara:strand:+ start:1418 stop:1534 length:117 start_codon:yes stop_codon:yes gene_type:complete